MLVLSRRQTESIQIGNDVLVTVLEICGNRVRIGIEAPKAIPVHRSEVSARIIGLHSRPPPGKGDEL